MCYCACSRHVKTRVFFLSSRVGNEFEFDRLHFLASMCKHILNAQVSVRSACCKKWFDCPDCHAESEKHELVRATEMVFACKKCKKVFRKDMGFVCLFSS
jgi:hypothetical protein